MPDYDRAAKIISFTTCEHCGITLPQMLAMVVTKHTNRKDEAHHFCGELCANDFYLERLRDVREAGL